MSLMIQAVLANARASAAHDSAISQMAGTRGRPFPGTVGNRYPAGVPVHDDRRNLGARGKSGPGVVLCWGVPVGPGTMPNLWPAWSLRALQKCPATAGGCGLPGARPGGRGAKISAEYPEKDTTGLVYGSWCEVYGRAERVFAVFPASGWGGACRGPVGSWRELMMAADPRYRPGAVRGDGVPGGGRRSAEELAVAEDHEGWLARTRVTLTPIAAPSIMGLSGFMIATLMLGAWQAGWYGSAATPLLIWPLAMVAGGVLQSVAAVASFRARDGVAVAAHTAWGSFWVGWGILELLVATHVLPVIPLGAANPSLGMWFAALGALAQNMGIFVTLGTLAAGAALTAAGDFAGSLGTLQAGGWLFVVSAAAALLVVGAMVLEHSFGRTIIPLGKWSARAPGPPTRSPTQPACPASKPASNTRGWRPGPR